MSTDSSHRNHSRLAPPAAALPSTEPVCALHPGSHVRRYRTHGPNGAGVYPQCMPANGAPPHLLSWTAPGAVPAPLPDLTLLTPSESAVLNDAAAGLTVGETARKRLKSVETVKTQRRSILLKLGARNIAHAVAMTMQQRMHELEVELGLAA